MANTALILSAFAVSNLANRQNGNKNFADLVEEFGKKLDVSQFTAEQLANICDFADDQRQAGFNEGVSFCKEKQDLSGSEERSTDTCTDSAPADKEDVKPSEKQHAKYCNIFSKNHINSGQRDCPDNASFEEAIKLGIAYCKDYLRLHADCNQFCFTTVSGSDKDIPEARGVVSRRADNRFSVATMVPVNKDWGADRFADDTASHGYSVTLSDNGSNANSHVTVSSHCNEGLNVGKSTNKAILRAFDLLQQYNYSTAKVTVYGQGCKVARLFDVIATFDIVD